MKPLSVLFSVLLPLALLACSNVNDPDDVVTEIDICNPGCNQKVYQIFENGNRAPNHISIDPGDCETWILPTNDNRNWTGSDSIPFIWYAEDGKKTERTMIPLNRKQFTLPCN